MQVKREQVWVPVAFANIFLIWGSTFLAVAYGLKGFPPFILSGLRFFLAGMILMTWLMARGERPTSPAGWRRNGLAGLLILMSGTGLVAWGEQYVSSTEAAIAIATGPFWFIAMDRRNWRYYFADRFIVTGLLLGFAGLILFLGSSIQASAHGAASGGVRVTAFVVLLVSSVAWVLGSLYTRSRPAAQSTLLNIAQQLIVGGLGCFIIALLRGEWAAFDIRDVPVVAWGGLLFLVLFGSIVAYVSYIWLLTVRPPALVSTHTYINPIVAVLLGWIVAGDAIGGNQLTGLFVILMGVLLINAKQYALPKRIQVRFRTYWRQLSRVSWPYRHITHL